MYLFNLKHFTAKKNKCTFYKKKIYIDPCWICFPKTKQLHDDMY